MPRILTHVLLVMAAFVAPLAAQQGTLTGSVSTATMPTFAAITVNPATPTGIPGIAVLNLAGGRISGFAVTDLGSSTFLSGYYTHQNGYGYMRFAARYTFPPDPVGSIHVFEAKWFPDGSVVGGWRQIN